MDRYSRYVAERKAERRAKIVAALRKTILEVKANGQFPSRWRMRKRLPNPNWMAEKWVRIEWRRMVKEMGFVFRDN
jgi:hypothetical protein